MNKRIILLTALFALLITLILFVNYRKTKKELQSEYRYTFELIKKAKEIQYLKNRFKLITPPVCSKIYEGDKIRLVCKNLTKYQLREINRVLKNSKIISFDIEKNKKIDARLELKK